LRKQWQLISHCLKKKKKRIQRSCVQSVYTNTKFAVALPQYTRSSQ